VVGHLFQALEAVQTRLAADLVDRLSPAALELWPRRLRIVQFVPAAGIRQSDLAAKALITKQALGEHLDALCAAGFLERVPDPDDGRVWQIRLTAPGNQVVEDFARALAEVEQTLVDAVGAQRFSQFRATLDLLAEAG
jgi:DNA-binding MarR family transcriptional regulator